jgi:predicted PurR-regulated permease PerM
VTDTADRVIDAVAHRIPVNKEAIRTELIERMKAASGYALNNLGAAVGGVTNVAITIVLVTVFLYCLLQYGGEWIRRLAEVVPLSERSTNNILNTVRDSVIANVNGVLAVALVQGTMLILGFWFLGVRAPVLWGVAGGFASVIPVIGAPLVWVPVAVAYLFTGAYWKALMLFVWGAIFVGSVDNFLRPVVVGVRDKQHPILIGLAAIGGTFAFGPLGIFLGPLAVSLASALFKELQVLSADKPTRNN